MLSATATAADPQQHQQTKEKYKDLPGVDFEAPAVYELPSSVDASLLATAEGGGLLTTGGGLTGDDYDTDSSVEVAASNNPQIDMTTTANVQTSKRVFLASERRPARRDERELLTAHGTRRARRRHELASSMLDADGMPRLQEPVREYVARLSEEVAEMRAALTELGDVAPADDDGQKDAGAVKTLDAELTELFEQVRQMSKKFGVAVESDGGEGDELAERLNRLMTTAAAHDDPTKQPQPARPAASSQVDVALEQRLSALEKSLGLEQTSHTTATTATSLVSLVESLERQMSLLTRPGLLDKLLTPALSALGGGTSTLSGGAATSNEQVQLLDQLNRLAPLLESMDAYDSFVPQLITRLQALQSVHAESACVTDVLKQCAKEQDAMRTMVEQVEKSVAKLERRMEECVKQCVANVERLK